MRGQITQQLSEAPTQFSVMWQRLSRTQASKPLMAKAHYRHCGLVRGRNHSQWYI